MKKIYITLVLLLNLSVFNLAYADGESCLDKYDEAVHILHPSVFVNIGVFMFTTGALYSYFKPNVQERGTGIADDILTTIHLLSFLPKTLKIASYDIKGYFSLKYGYLKMKRILAPIIYGSNDNYNEYGNYADDLTREVRVSLTADLIMEINKSNFNNKESLSSKVADNIVNKIDKDFVLQIVKELSDNDLICIGGKIRSYDSVKETVIQLIKSKNEFKDIKENMQRAIVAKDILYGDSQENQLLIKDLSSMFTDYLF